MLSGAFTGWGALRKASPSSETHTKVARNLFAVARVWVHVSYRKTITRLRHHGQRHAVVQLP